MKILEDYFKDCQVVIIDIETTGLVSEKNKVILGGLIVVSENTSEAIQFFAETKADEKLMLEKFLPYLTDADVIITYNGYAFDLPFINKRLIKNDLPGEIPLYKSFDLYKILQKSSFSKILPNLKQKTVEDYMGIRSERADQISGKQCVDCYEAYLATRNPQYKEAILNHNRDDLFQLKKLLGLLINLDLHQAMYHNGFNVIDFSKKININQIHFGPKSVSVKGFHIGLPMDFVSFSETYKVNLSLKTKSICIDIPLIKEGFLSYVDLTLFHFDQQPFEKYPGYQNGYLIVKSGKEIHYAEINQLLRRICREILAGF